MPRKVKILGIDAAFSNIGLALMSADMDDQGVLSNFFLEDLVLIHTAPQKRKRGVPRSTDDMRRARESVDGIRAMIAKHQPDYIAAEIPFGSQSARASWALGIALGVLAGVDDLIQVTPLQVKAASGEKHADKDYMIEWAMGLYPDAPWRTRKLKGNLVQVAGVNEHLADAVGVVHAAAPTIALRVSGTV